MSGVASSPGIADHRHVAAVSPPPAFGPLHAQHQKSAARLARQEWGELVLGVKGTVRLVMLEVALTMTKDHCTSSNSSDVEKTVSGSYRACV